MMYEHVCGEFAIKQLPLRFHFAHARNKICPLALAPGPRYGRCNPKFTVTVIDTAIGLQLRSVSSNSH